MGREFDLIDRYFSRKVPAGYLGGGDDCALLPVVPGMQMAVSTDLLIEGRHFFPDVSPFTLGHKALAVNLSDLAAMGAKPLGCVLGIALPSINEAWLAAFADGFYALAEAAACPLVGGDTTAADNITLCVTVFGQVDPALALRRSAAQAGDDIWVTGVLGGPHVALQLLQGRVPPGCNNTAALLAQVRASLEQPSPPIAFSQGLPGLAHAALDISDGLLQDLGHILKASRCGAQLFYDNLPVDPALAGVSQAWQEEAVLGGGDVYQLCFTAPVTSRSAIQALAHQHSVLATRIGTIVSQAGQLSITRNNGQVVSVAHQGFQHF